MSNSIIQLRIKPYIQPFERNLAIRELAMLSDSQQIYSNDDESIYIIEGALSIENLVERLAFWEAILENDHNGNGKWVSTRQSRIEASTIQPLVSDYYSPHQNTFTDMIPQRFVKKRALRYGPHGMHEYRGKFFPQLVRSIINISSINKGGIVLDPMCGSGTTLVETVVAGINAIGIDMNPLSVLMSKAKVDILKVPPEKLEKEYSSLRSYLSLGKRGHSRTWFDSLKNSDKEYLAEWLPEKSIDELDPITTKIMSIKSKPVQQVFLIAISNIIRSVSWQKDDDLRVRKELSSAREDVRQTFIDELDRSIRSLLDYFPAISGLSLGDSMVIEGDSRKTAEILGKIIDQADLIITSPPYATALPYLDTDRLSLSYLGLLPRNAHRAKDKEMIGNREISIAERNKMWNQYLKFNSSLPSSITNIIEQVNNLYEYADVGFRRKNKPSLLAKYFFDMREVLLSLQKVLRLGGLAILIVGSNHTGFGDVQIEIRTDHLLSELAESVGFLVEDKISMEMLNSRDIFKDKSGKAESIIFLRKCQ